MPTDRLRREINSVNRGLRQYQRETGQTVVWYEYDTANSTEGSVYDEGPSRRWKVGKPVHCLFVMYYESEISPDVTDEGLYEVDRLHLTVAADQFSRDGISNPRSPDEHERDRVVYEGKTYEVRKYRLRGRTADTYMVVTVDLVEVKADDTELDDPMTGTTWGDLARAGTTWGKLTTNGTTWGQLHGA